MPSIEQLVEKARELEKQLRSAQSKLRRRDRRIEKLAAHLEAAQDEATREIEALHHERDQLRRDVEKAHADLAAKSENCDKLTHELETVRQEHRKVSAEFEADHARFEQISTALEDQVADLSRQLEERAKDVDDVKKVVAEKDQKLEAAYEWAGTVERDRDSLKGEVDRIRADLGVALRLQGLATADLRDLQGKYSALASKESRQAELLGRLSSALGEAATFVDSLLDDGDEFSIRYVGDLLEGARSVDQVMREGDAKTAVDEGGELAEPKKDASQAATSAETAARNKSSLDLKSAAPARKKRKAKKAKPTGSKPTQKASGSKESK